MFGKNQKNGSPAAPRTGAPTGNSHNSLVQGTRIKGDITAASDLRIDGEIDGNVQCDARLVIGPTGKIEGEVTCKDAVIEGIFSGKIRVADTLSIRENASVEGEIRYGKIVVQPGAKLNGDVRMNGSEPSGSVKPREARSSSSSNGKKTADAKISGLEKARN